MIKMQQLSFSGAGKPFYAKLRINFTYDFFQKPINTYIVMYQLVDHLEFT